MELQVNITCISDLNGQLGQLCLQHGLLFMSHGRACLRWQVAVIRLHTDTRT